MTNSLEANINVSPATQKGRWGKRLLKRLEWVGLLPLLPLLLTWRGVSRARQYLKLASIDDEYTRSHHQMQQSSQAATVFLALHLRQLHELRQRYLITTWRSLEEAEAGFQLLLQADWFYKHRPPKPPQVSPSRYGKE